MLCFACISRLTPRTRDDDINLPRLLRLRERFAIHNTLVAKGISQTLGLVYQTRHEKFVVRTCYYTPIDSPDAKHCMLTMTFSLPRRYRSHRREKLFRTPHALDTECA
jgi:hypothetical protein